HPLESWHAPHLKSLLANFRELRDSKSGETHRRACICVGSSFYTAGVVTVGGFRADTLRDIAGVLRGETESVARNSAMPSVPAPVLREWATEQARLVASTKLPGDYRLEAASLVMLCGGDASDLPVAIRDGEYLTVSALGTWLRGLDEVETCEGSEIEYDEDDDVRPKAFRNDFKVSPALFLVPRRARSILSVGKQSWPECVPELYLADQPKCCEDAFHGALKRAWGIEPESDEDSRVVGEVRGEEISRQVRIYSRPLDPSILKNLLEKPT
ncbi:MAG: hypothetical protein NT154_40360, partial [Verrucomicrobia bacterium]|nr:hypothetical protein [Verrucomicrobiota bacterium]